MQESVTINFIFEKEFGLKYRCGKISVNPLNGTTNECRAEARWESPERLRTTGKLKVCAFHKKEMEDEYRKEKKPSIFKLL